jgi:hypothetical protein
MKYRSRSGAISNKKIFIRKLGMLLKFKLGYRYPGYLLWYPTENRVNLNDANLVVILKAQKNNNTMLLLPGTV